MALKSILNHLWQFLNPEKKESTKAITDLAAHCDFCGKYVFLPYRGSYGRYFCSDHHLPENRGEIGYSKPSFAYRTIYFSNGKTEYKK